MNIIQMDSRDAGYLFSSPDKSTMDFLSERVSHFVSTHGSDLGSRVKARFDDVIKGATFRRIQAIKNKYNGIFQVDGICYLTTVGRIQNAPDAMVNFIMANPESKELYNDSRIEGYGSRWTVSNKAAVGMDDLRYRQVISGILRKEEDSYICRNIYQPGQDVNLTLGDKFNILNVWKVCNEAYEEGIDCTSADNELIS